MARHHGLAVRDLTEISLARSTTEQLVGTTESVELSPRFLIRAMAKSPLRDSGMLGSSLSHVLEDLRSSRDFSGYLAVPFKEALCLSLCLCSGLLMFICSLCPSVFVIRSV